MYRRILIILLISSTLLAQPCQDYPCDSMVVRAILDSNGLFSTLVEDVGFGGGRISHLILRGRGLSVLPAAVGRLTFLAGLWLDSNSLSQLPPQIGALTSLRELRATHNSLAQLPPELGTLHALRTMEVDHNSLTSLPAAVGQMDSLRHLHLGHNSLSRLPPEICQLSALGCLQVNHNALVELPLELGSLRLRWLAIDSNALTDLPLSLVGRPVSYLTVCGNYLTDLVAELASWVSQYSREPDWQSCQRQGQAIRRGPQSPKRTAELQATEWFSLSGKRLTQATVQHVSVVLVRTVSRGASQKARRVWVERRMGHNNSTAER